MLTYILQNEHFLHILLYQSGRGAPSSATHPSSDYVSENNFKIGTSLVATATLGTKYMFIYHIEDEGQFIFMFILYL